MGMGKSNGGHARAEILRAALAFGHAVADAVGATEPASEGDRPSGVRAKALPIDPEVARAVREAMRGGASGGGRP
jgi:hypothetical protein